MKKTPVIVLILIFTSLLLMACRSIKEPQVKEEVRVPTEEAKLEPSVIEAEVLPSEPVEPIPEPEVQEPRLTWQKDFESEAM
jgi:hypothetical protein